MMSMIIFDVFDDDLFLFDDFKKEHHENVIISSSRNYIGGRQFHEIMIVAVPAVISSLALVFQSILSYKQSQYNSEKKQCF